MLVLRWSIDNTTNLNFKKEDRDVDGHIRIGLFSRPEFEYI